VHVIQTCELCFSLTLGLSQPLRWASSPSPAPLSPLSLPGFRHRSTSIHISLSSSSSSSSQSCPKSRSGIVSSLVILAPLPFCHPPSILSVAIHFQVHWCAWHCLRVLGRYRLCVSARAWVSASVSLGLVWLVREGATEMCASRCNQNSRRSSQKFTGCTVFTQNKHIIAVRVPQALSGVTNTPAVMPPGIAMEAISACGPVSAPPGELGIQDHPRILPCHACPHRPFS
jgi:hypothetical protein